jgi:hypothetical protein
VEDTSPHIDVVLDHRPQEGIGKGPRVSRLEPY